MSTHIHESSSQSYVTFEARCDKCGVHLGIVHAQIPYRFKRLCEYCQRVSVWLPEIVAAIVAELRRIDPAQAKQEP